VLKGETADVIILSRPVMDELQKQDKFVPGTIADVAGIAVAVTVRAGAPKPDISSADALKRPLLAASSIVYADPAKSRLTGRVTRLVSRSVRPAGDQRHLGRGGL
jgi:molybdate transport system substrate-binding protein